MVKVLSPCPTTNRIGHADFTCRLAAETSLPGSHHGYRLITADSALYQKLIIDLSS